MPGQVGFVLEEMFFICYPNRKRRKRTHEPTERGGNITPLLIVCYMFDFADLVYCMPDLFMLASCMSLRKPPRSLLMVHCDRPYVQRRHQLNFGGELLLGKCKAVRNIYCYKLRYQG